MQVYDEKVIQLQKNQKAGCLQFLPPLSLYIHLPWCVRKCPYCDFNSHRQPDDFAQLEGKYIDALIEDIESELPSVWGRPVVSIFLGGGTPSVFSGRAITNLLNAVRARFRVLPDAEITIEVNPSRVDQNHFEMYREEAGINRVSIGVQSFSDQHLRVLGRVHTAEEAFWAIELANRLFERVNVDLMYALPDQTSSQALSDVRLAVQSGVDHISAYQLTLEPHTPFAARPPDGLPDEHLAEEIEKTIHACLDQHGFSRYEISAFSKGYGTPSRHNLNYWMFGDYLGIGAGAHGKISDGTHIVRSMKIKHPLTYITSSPHKRTLYRRAISVHDLPFEFMMNVLRLTDGVPRSLWQERTGLGDRILYAPTQHAIQKGLLENNPLMFRPTSRGLLFVNDTLALFTSRQAQPD